MTTPSEFSSMGLSINIYRPSIIITAGAPNVATYNPRDSLAEDLADRVISYTHSEGVIGGFDTASFSFRAEPTELEIWWDVGLGLHVETTDEAGMIVWEGYVDAVRIDYGGASLVRGPLTDLHNQVGVVYQVEDNTTSPPLGNANRLLWPIENIISERLYGILPGQINVSSTSGALAQVIGNAWLAENAFPRATESISLSGGNREPSITLECKGYWYLMRWSYYSTTAGTWDASVKLAAILDGDATCNNLFASANATITDNTLQVPIYSADWAEAKSQITTVVSAGDATGTRYIFKVGPGRHCTYEPMSTAPAYRQALHAEVQAIETIDGDNLPPWEIKSGKWLYYLDWMPGRMPLPTLRMDSRYAFIERVTYTAPWEVSIEGGRTDRTDQMLAVLGLKGAPE